jgi:hypothetical protein
VAFCKLSPGQAAALMFIVGTMSSPKTPQEIKRVIQDKNWKTLQVLLNLGSSDNEITVPTEADIASVGNLPTGVQNADFLLAMIDVQGTDDAKTQFQQALDTHCWDWVAQTLLSHMTATGLTFTGADLHQAYAPSDNSPCRMPPQPSDFDKSIAKLINTGELVGDLFSKPLPDFFANDYPKFFKATNIPDFFKGPFAEFFVSIGDNIKDAFTGFTARVKEAFDDVGRQDSTQW